MAATTRPTNALPDGVRERVMECAREVSIPDGTRVFEEGRRADRFWVIRSGTVRLDLRVPTRPATVVETLHGGDLLGCSWLFPPYEWQLGAQAMGSVEAVEFDAAAVRALCDADPELGRALAQHVARVVAHRLHQARARLLEQYGPQSARVRTEEPA
jgi:CRP-like cAMP-binding protein